jgi:hypothetical protein
MANSAELIKIIAFELSILEGEVWTAEITGYYSDRLHSEKGNKLYLEVSQNRVHTSAGLPEGCTRHVQTPSKISSGACRLPGAIAQDIQRRFLPEARKYWQQCREEQIRHDQKVNDINRSVEALEARGMHRYSHHDADGERAQMYADGMKIDIYSNNEVYNFELSHLTITQAIQIIDLLKGEK